MLEMSQSFTFGRCGPLRGTGGPPVLRGPHFENECSKTHTRTHTHTHTHTHSLHPLHKSWVMCVELLELYVFDVSHENTPRPGKNRSQTLSLYVLTHSTHTLILSPLSLSLSLSLSL